MGKDLAIGVDIGGTKILAALVSGGRRILERRKEATPADAPPAEVFAAVRAAVKGVLDDAGVRPSSLKGMGVGVPGIVDVRSGRVVSAPNINLSGFPMGAALRKRFRVPVAVDNDVNLAVLGEARLGAGRGVRDLVGIFPGTGIGGGVIVDGRLLRGANGAGAEVGHMKIALKGPKCGCGNRGCLEALAGRRAIEREIRRAVKGGKRTSIKKLNKGKLGVIKSGVLRKALKRGDPVVSRVVKEAAEHLGSACVTLRHVFDPELFIFGGGLIEACGKYILPVVRKKMDADPFFKGLARCRVAASELGDDAAVLGAAVLIEER
ncbi:MAG: ROK family protein [Elusimicrobiota bacterium]